MCTVSEPDPRTKDPEHAAPQCGAFGRFQEGSAENWSRCLKMVRTASYSKQRTHSRASSQSPVSQSLRIIKCGLKRNEFLNIRMTEVRVKGEEGGACPWPQLIPSMAWKSNPLSKELRWRLSFVQKFQWQKIMAIPSLSCKFVQSSSCFHRPLENASLLSLIAHAWSEEWRKQITQLI